MLRAELAERTCMQGNMLGSNRLPARPGTQKPSIFTFKSSDCVDIDERSGKGFADSSRNSARSWAQFLRR